MIAFLLFCFCLCLCYNHHATHTSPPDSGTALLIYCDCDDGGVRHVNVTVPVFRRGWHARLLAWACGCLSCRDESESESALLSQYHGHRVPPLLLHLHPLGVTHVTIAYAPHRVGGRLCDDGLTRFWVCGVPLAGMVSLKVTVLCCRRAPQFSWACPARAFCERLQWPPALSREDRSLSGCFLYFPCNVIIFYQLHHVFSYKSWLPEMCAHYFLAEFFLG